MRVGGGSLSERLGACTEGRTRYVKDIAIDSKRYPESAQHILDAQGGKIWSGSDFAHDAPKPDVLTIDRAGCGRQSGRVVA
jgi:hypothetical protein